MNQTATPLSTPTVRWCDNLVKILTIFILAWAPFPLGSNRPLFVAILGVIVGITLLITVIAKPKIARVPHWFSLPFLIIIGWSALQVLPIWPASFAPDFWQPMHQFFNENVSFVPLSLNPIMGWFGWLSMLIYGAMFWLIYQQAQSSKQAWFLVKSIAVIGVGYAIFGLLQHVTQPNLLFIVAFEKFDYFHALTSTFVSKNAYATYAGIGLLCNATLMFRCFVLQRNRGMILWAIGSLILIVALLQTDSRGGQIATLFGLGSLGFFTLCSQQFHRYRKLIFGSMFASLLILAAGLSFFGLPQPERWMTTGEEWQLRSHIYGLSIDTAMQRPITGHGLSSFTPAFNPVRPINDSWPYELGNTINHAHSSYLESMVELGLPASIVILLMLGAFTVLLWQQIRRQKNHALLPILAISSLTLVASHALIDFTIDFPAVALLFSSLLALGISQRKKVISTLSMPAKYTAAGFTFISLIATWAALLPVPQANTFNQAELKTYLHQYPNDAFAWQNMSEALLIQNRQQAITALDLSLATSPIEPTLHWRRLKHGLILWPHLSKEIQNKVQQQLWLGWYWRRGILIGTLNTEQLQQRALNLLPSGAQPKLKRLLSARYYHGGSGRTKPPFLAD